MANHKQAQKRHRQSVIRTARNRYYTSTLRGLLKKARAAIVAGAEGAQDNTQAALKLIDRICTKGIIPKGRANRLKSRLATHGVSNG